VNAIAAHPDRFAAYGTLGLTGYGADGGLVQHPDVLSWAKFPDGAST